MTAMKLSDYLKAERGRVAALAKRLEVSGSLVTQWAGGKPVTAGRCVPIEQATDGQVMRWDLRPDDWHRIWPELQAANGAPQPAEEAVAS